MKMSCPTTPTPRGGLCEVKNVKLISLVMFLFSLSSDKRVWSLSRERTSVTLAMTETWSHLITLSLNGSKGP